MRESILVKIEGSTLDEQHDFFKRFRKALYLEQKAAPEPQNSVNHDDWVSGVDVQNGLILSACYDNTVCLWDTNATKKLQIPG